MVELLARVSENMGDFDRELAQLAAAAERIGDKLSVTGTRLTRGITVPLGLPSLSLQGDRQATTSARKARLMALWELALVVVSVWVAFSILRDVWRQW